MQDKKEINKNYGIEILRLILAYVVILCHFYKMPENTPSVLDIFFGRSMLLAVPCFFIISFTLCGEDINSGNWSWIKKRIFRILYPFFVWNSIYYLIYTFLWKRKNLGEKIEWNDLIWQFLTGSSSSLNRQMWFQVLLFACTGCIFIISMLVKKASVRKLLYIGNIFLMVWLQYSGINYQIFENMSYEIRYSWGRFAEVVPVVMIGMLLSESIVLHNIRKYWFFIDGICVMIFILVSEMNIPFPQGFWYQGIESIIKASCVFVGFYVIPLEGLHEQSKKILTFLSKGTFGVYAIHIFIGDILNICLSYMNIQLSSLLGCLLIYTVSLGIACICSQSRSKYIQYLFI